MEAKNLVFGITRKSLAVIKVHACPHCEAPGVYKNDEHNRRHWPGIVDEKRVDQAVGDICPNCHKLRKFDLYHGEVASSMPLWVWNSILVLKWCVVKVLSLKT